MTTRYFTANDCSIWLASMSKAQFRMTLNRYFNGHHKNVEKIMEDKKWESQLLKQEIKRIEKQE